MAKGSKGHAAAPVGGGKKVKPRTATNLPSKGAKPRARRGQRGY